MAALSQTEITYLKSQILGRIATADASGRPHVTPVGFTWNDASGTIDVSGYDLSSTKKVKDIRENPSVAFVVDDLESIKPWRPRGVSIRGTAIIAEDPASPGVFGTTRIRITPLRVASWGLESPVFAAR